MNKYVGTKEVLAKPMTRREYNDYRGWELPSDENPNDEGYLVEYLNGGKPNDARHEGYISWSPVDVFNNAYKPADTFLDRLKLEQVEVQTRLDGLTKTLDVERKPDFISEDQWILMTRQQFHMRMYAQIIGQRIDEAEGKPVFINKRLVQLEGSENTKRRSSDYSYKVE